LALAEQAGTRKWFWPVTIQYLALLPQLAVAVALTSFASPGTNGAGGGSGGGGSVVTSSQPGGTGNTPVSVSHRKEIMAAAGAGPNNGSVVAVVHLLLAANAGSTRLREWWRRHGIVYFRFVCNLRRWRRWHLHCGHNGGTGGSGGGGMVRAAVMLVDRLGTCWNG
jgi:hypothetical protein